MMLKILISRIRWAQVYLPKVNLFWNANLCMDIFGMLIHVWILAFLM